MMDFPLHFCIFVSIIQKKCNVNKDSASNITLIGSASKRIFMKQTDMKEKEAAFSQLVKREKGTIYSLCLLFAEDKSLVNDMVQECLINLWKGFDGFEGRSSIRTWIYRVCMNTCISFDRQRKHTSGYLVELDPQFMRHDDEGAVAARQYEMLHERIKQLGPFDRALMLLWLEDLPYEEIGAIIGISANNVGARLTRIREQLKQMNNPSNK